MIETVGRSPRLRQLGGYVDRLWYVRDPDIAGWELKLPTSTAQVIINLDAERLSTRFVEPDDGSVPRGELSCGGVGLTPIADVAEVLDRTQQRRTVGIVIRPEAVGALIGESAEDLDVLVDLDSLVPFGAERLATAAAAGQSGNEVLDLVEGELARLVHDGAEPDAGCRAGIELLRSGCCVAEVAEQLGTSQSTLSRRFRSAIGMTPKRYQRLLRLERAIGLAAHDQIPDWATIAVQSGCYDQAHLNHEFSDLTGLTPTQWHRAGSGNPFHIRLDDDFLQDPNAAGHQDDDHERAIPERDAVPALSRR